MRLMEYFRDLNYDVTVQMVRGFPLDIARNNICERFLESKSEYLLMIDDDMAPCVRVVVAWMDFGIEPPGLGAARGGEGKGNVEWG